MSILRFCEVDIGRRNNMEIILDMLDAAMSILSAWR